MYNFWDINAPVWGSRFRAVLEVLSPCVLWLPRRESLVHFPYVPVQVTREGTEGGVVPGTYCVGPLFSEAVFQHSLSPTCIFTRDALIKSCCN